MTTLIFYELVWKNSIFDFKKDNAWTSVDDYSDHEYIIFFNQKLILR